MWVLQITPDTFVIQTENMSNRVLGAIALLGAPWLCIGMYLEQTRPELSDSWFTGAWGIIYLTAWMCSIVALQRLEATGDSRFGKIILWVLLFSLTIANVSNVIQVIVEKNKPSYFMAIDLFWPLSNLLMLVVGIQVIIANRIKGWKKYVPLVVGMWLPLAFLSMAIESKNLMFPGIYSAIAWSVLAAVVFTTEKQLRVKTAEKDSRLRIQDSILK